MLKTNSTGFELMPQVLFIKSAKYENNQVCKICLYLEIGNNRQ